MFKKELKLVSGQNLRYVGKGFPGYVKGQPYMVFLAYHRFHEMMVSYNDTTMVVNKHHTDPVL